MECYVFESEGVALSALAYINAVGGTPIIGRNAYTGELSPAKAKIETWDSVKQRVTDNKYFFIRVDQATRDLYPQSVLDNFNANYPHTVEVFNDTWTGYEGEVL